MNMKRIKEQFRALFQFPKEGISLNAYVAANQYGVTLAKREVEAFRLPPLNLEQQGVTRPTVDVVLGIERIKEDWIGLFDIQLPIFEGLEATDLYVWRKYEELKQDGIIDEMLKLTPLICSVEYPGLVIYQTPEELRQDILSSLSGHLGEIFSSPSPVVKPS
jgi:hypothetical protein